VHQRLDLVREAAFEPAHAVVAHRSEDTAQAP
jgi:hypothetical protein